MDTALIFSISNFSKARCSLGWALLLFIGIACSSRESKKAVNTSELDRALKALPVEDAPGPVYGPTSSQGFTDKTAAYGLSHLEGVWFGAVDLNRDQYDDLVLLPGYFHQPRFFFFDPTAKKFVETPTLFNDSQPASYLTFVDFNRDGVTDALTGVLNQRGEFTKIPLTMWLGSWDAQGRLRFVKDENFLKLTPEPTSSVAIIDVNLDGRLDIFMGNWYSDFKGSLIPTADRLLVNTSNGWQDKTDWLTGEAIKSSNELFPSQARPTYGVSTCDMDQDGWPDILTASSGGHGNKLWMNRPPLAGSNLDGRRFVDIGRESRYAHDANGGLVPTGGGRTFTAVCADYNDDSIMDAFLGEQTHGWDNVSVDRSSVLTGARQVQPLSFLRTEYMADNNSDNWNQGDKRATWDALTPDGPADILVDNSGFPPQSRLVAFMQDETRAFNNVAPQWGIDLVNPVGSILLDINKDGKPDIITGQSNIRQADIKGRLYVLENNLTTSGRSKVFYLEGKQANAQGIGAMVMLYTIVDGKQIIQRRWNELVQGGLSSQHSEGVRFGVGSNGKVLGVNLRWPFL